MSAVTNATPKPCTCGDLIRCLECMARENAKAIARRTAARRAAATRRRQRNAS